MAENNDDSSMKKEERQNVSGATNWGPRLFLGVFVAILAFFYWLLIYSGGVSVHHG